MPLYAYSCSDCEANFEVLATKPPPPADVKCPDCEGKNVARCLSLPAKASASNQPATNCRGDGPPCGAAWCGRK